MRKIADVCILAGCGRPYEARGYCVLHYGRLRRGKNLTDPLKLHAALHLPLCKWCRGRVRPHDPDHEQACGLKHAAQAKRFRNANPGWWAAYSKDYRKRPHVRAKYLANKKLQEAVASGLIIKPSRCVECNRIVDVRRLQGHHQDYTKPLEVEWLCDPCHKGRHHAC